MDIDKQVVTQEVQSGPENAPIVVEQGKRAGVISPVREAGMEVVSSSQTQSREENASIPVGSEEAKPEEDIKSMSKSTSATASTDPSPTSKEPPPAYDKPDGAVDTLSRRPEDRTAVGQLLNWIPSSPGTPTEKSPRLERPVVIPQLDVLPVGESVPFQRCYSDLLTSHDVPIREFAAFLDDLTVAQASTSALQGLKMLGAGISMVPIPLIPLAGRGISALASSSSGKSGSRVQLYLSRASREYFAPRGLRVSTIKDDDLTTQALRVPPNAPRLEPLSKDTLIDSICTRRLDAICRYAAPLRWDVPEQDSDVKKVDKLARKHLQHNMGQNAKEVAKLREEQWKGRGFECAVEEEKGC